MYSPQDSISTTAVVEVIVAICLKSLLTPECYKLTRETRRFNSKLFPYKLHKNFVHFKYSLPVNKKNILGEHLRSLTKYVELFTPRMNNLETKQLCIETTANPCM